MKKPEIPCYLRISGLFMVLYSAFSIRYPTPICV